MKQPVDFVIYSCGGGNKRPVATFARGNDWTRAYKLTESSATRLSRVINTWIQGPQWFVRTHSLGWTAYPIPIEVKK